MFIENITYQNNYRKIIEFRCFVHLCVISYFVANLIKAGGGGDIHFFWLVAFLSRND